MIIGSFAFYAWGEIRFFPIMVALSIEDYICGRLMEKHRANIKLRRLFLTISLLSNLGVLIFFKYTNFFVSNFTSLFGIEGVVTNIILPIGISFFTFQIMSYTIDVFLRNVKTQRNPFKLALYISLFPQLIAGPIVRYTTVEAELKERTHSLSNFAVGFNRFILGLGKKVLIANTLGELCEIFRASDEKSFVFYWIYALAFCLHVYFDFSGYSDMAIGLGRVFGFHFLENFNYPFISKSVAEFWRRWHMSLGTWFRDYVYIPLGGNRVSMPMWFRNILVVWFLTGFWHGADWTFIVWGLYFALFLLLEKFFLAKFFAKLPGVFSHIYVLFVVAISFVIFNANGMGQAISDIGGLIGLQNVPFFNSETLYYMRSYGVVLLLGILGATPLVKRSVEKLRATHAGDWFLTIAEPVVQIALIVVITAYLVDGSFNPFLYFRF
jgi:alginate O-acetyltransferase complex protein AlgI